MKKKSLNNIYRLPLPVHVRPLPPVVLHNPLSVLYYIWDYMFPAPVSKKCFKGTLSSDGKFVKVESESDMDELWAMGFFGKGILSRSEPTWYTRTARRLKLEGGDKITAEDITNARREERKKWKQQRAKAEEEELARRRALDDPNAVQPVETKRAEETEQSLENLVREEDDEVIVGDKLKQLEYLQLMPVETIFLAYGLGVLQVDDLTTQELFEKFNEDPKFLHYYAAYHHYRSKGWCVKSGVKFGTDYLLYKRGPPFSHAEFATMIMPVGTPQETPNWWWNTNIGRVIGGVRKTLIFSYVQVPESIDGFETVREILEACYIRELVYRRWIPARCRD